MTTHHHTRRLARVAAAAVTGAALAAPPALARPIDSPPTPLPAYSGPAIDIEGDAPPAGAPVVQRIDGGFDWGSAAIGAGGAGGLVAVVALGGVAYGVRRRTGVARWSAH
jgi:hypothetical protein